MKIEFDPAKSEKNSEERDLPFDRATDFDWAAAKYAEDVRNTYPEPRFIAVGYLDKRLHVLCFTPVPGGVRVISFRKANDREAKRYGKTITVD
ncbi:MAG: hypothetical protein ACD_75C00858G0003 [uncultured bacterium]|nr:MAG: hypothetical protein ACD_75C00858G0003 [uncultured bacterium]